MVIVYRQTGSLLILLALAGAAIVLTVAVTGALLIAGAAAVIVALSRRVVILGSRRWPHAAGDGGQKTIEATVVNASSVSKARNSTMNDDSR